MINNLLLIRFSALGDVALLAPIVRSLAVQYPSLQITVLSRENFKDIFANFPENVHFFGADLKGKHKGIKGLIRLFREIDYGRFDAVGDMHNVLRSRFLLFLFWLKGIQTACLHKGRISRSLLLHCHLKPIQTMQNRHLQTLIRLGLVVDLPTTSPQENIQKDGIGIAPFAAFPTKTYPIEKMEKVVEKLCNHTKIYLFGGGKNEKEVLESWEKKYPNVVSCAGKYSLGEELEMMRHLKAMITMDSSNMHLASLVGTRVISVWGATHPYAGFLGWGQRLEDCVQVALPCRPCSIFGSKKCKLGTLACLKNISEDEIINRVLSHE